jgi:hypothetical protein
MKRLLSMCLLLVLVAVAGVTPKPPPASAQDDLYCFDTTGHCISGAFRAYWEEHGGLDVFGYPISAVEYEYIRESDWIGAVQWFERDRLEDHSPDGQGILAGRLGARMLEIESNPWERWPTVESAPPGCHFFELTSHSLCEPFLSYWNEQGGIERFGLPITEATEATIEERQLTVQYFERRRMEYHPQLAGTPYEISLGLLGSAIYSELRDCWKTYPALQGTAAAHYETIGCPLAGGEEGVPLISQVFERGSMLRLPTPQLPDDAIFYIIFQDDERDTLIWEEVQPDPDAAPRETTPPPGRAAPGEHLLEAWRTNPRVYHTLGWAMAPEQQETATWQEFREATMIYRHAGQVVAILHSDHHVEEVERVP